MSDYPKDWEEVKLVDIPIQIKKGDLITKKEIANGKIPVIAGGKSPAYYCNRYNREGTTITVSASGANAGYVNLFYGQIFASDCSTIEEDRSYCIEYIYYLMAKEQENIYKLQTGGAQPHVHPKDIKKLEIIYSRNIEEQKSIAETLMTFDRHIENLEKLIEKKKMIRDGAVEDLMTGKTRLDGFDGEWEKLLLGDIFKINMCKRVFSYQTVKNGKIPFFKIGTFGKKADAYISEELFNQYKHLYPYPSKGDSLISASGSIGKIVVYNGENSYYQDSNIVWLKTNLNIVDKSFLYFYLRTFPWKITEGTTIKRLYNNIILETEINLPTDIKEQQAIASILTSMDEEIENLEKEKAKIEKIKAGAMDDLLTGRVRLI
ncbi:restriction endonuclease subunit S [Finegoldia magna]|uniref:Type I restriction-modification enzyme specificity subunit n=1 Tax=Finegoldia magna (strain ATCC 29328 / DSM 20472 / WAL 2508) TaxID=334413 RepID=B0RZN7_FINM2|nr:restriction endonuclease subunit S [Finegoldia magna]UEA69534.1 restriction endonuclease subunit S [Finegoldia magna]BAG07496.1 type I restriction-modification enzyme specificity subunit [Finegoldia magna ATCC 29328]